MDNKENDLTAAMASLPLMALECGWGLIGLNR